MRRSSLGLVLIALNVSLALVAVAGLAAAAAALFRRFTDQQAFERVRLASVSAERGIVAEGEALATLTRVLAEDPRATDDKALERLRTAGGLYSVGFARQPSAVGAEFERTARPPGWIIDAPKAGGLELNSWAPLAGGRGTLGATKLLDASFAKRLSERSGATVKIVDAARGIGEIGDPKLPLRAPLLRGAETQSRRLDELGVYAAVAAIKDPDGRVVGFLESEIPTLPARASRQRLVERLSMLALVIGGLAAIGSVLIARHIALPLTRLTESADRLGGGDLTTPVSTAGSAEIGRLGASMEDMRRRLRRLTLDLEAQKADARAIVDGIVEGVYVVDRERRVVQMNAQAESLLGVSAKTAIGKFCGDVLNPEDVGGARPCEENCPILHARFRGDARATERLVAADGRRRTVIVSSSVSGGDRQVQLLRDETEVEAARRLRDAVLANISHEFKTPLAAQLASLEVLVDRFAELGPEEARKLIVSSQRGALRLNQLIDNLLESVRIEAGRLVLRNQSVRLDEVVEEAVEMIRPLTDQRGQTIEVALPHPLPAVAGDAPRLVQVFVNLLANAGKFAPDRTTIRVGGNVDAASVTLFVEDEGPGWSDDVEPRIFEPFVRSTSEEPDSSGVGLGLYIAKAIVERHGGRIDARVAGGRTRVAVRLPVGVLA
jgi:signal transduction histidine kinase